MPTGPNLEGVIMIEGATWNDVVKVISQIRWWTYFLHNLLIAYPI
jgi:hypothetical protein